MDLPLPLLIQSPSLLHHDALPDLPAWLSTTSMTTLWIVTGYGLQTQGSNARAAFDMQNWWDIFILFTIASDYHPTTYRAWCDERFCDTAALMCWKTIWEGNWNFSPIYEKGRMSLVFFKDSVILTRVCSFLQPRSLSVSISISVMECRHSSQKYNPCWRSSSHSIDNIKTKI